MTERRDARLPADFERAVLLNPAVATALTDRQLLELCAEQFEFLRRVALADGRILRNGIRVPKWHVVVEECAVARERVLAHLAEVALS